MKSCFIRSDSTKAEWYEQEIKKIDTEIIEMKMAGPALRALVNASIFTVKELRTKSIDELSALHGMGPSAIKRLKTLMK